MAEFKRKLASVKVIDAINPIEGADKIEVATIDGWNVVVRKNEFKVGDKIIYIEVDSILPERPEFEFMRERKFRVRTIKLRKQISQGICFPVNILPKGEWDIDEDVTEVLGVKKYECDKWNQKIYNPIKKEKGFYRGFLKPLFYKGIFKIIGNVNTLGEWPRLFPHTDEPRIQHIIKILQERYVDTPVYVTEKMHGCLDAKTKIETEFGLMTIEDICNSKEKIKVLTYNHENNEYEFLFIENMLIGEETDDWYELILEDNTKILLTGNHPVWIKEKNCYVEAKNLISGQNVLKFR